jgi:hypothetical protein
VKAKGQSHRPIRRRRHQRKSLGPRRVDWDAQIRIGCNPNLGSEVGTYHLRGELTEAQAFAGHYYAVLAGRYDHFFGLSRRHIPSNVFDGSVGSVAGPALDDGAAGAAYDGDFGGQNGEVERHERNGTIKAYERRAKKIKKEWKRAQDAMANNAVREVVDRVCIYNQPILSDQLPVLAAALERLARLFGLKGARLGQKIATWHKPDAKLGGKGNR